MEKVTDSVWGLRVVELARELYDRFVMGGWEPQHAYPFIAEVLDEERTAGREHQFDLKEIGTWTPPYASGRDILCYQRGVHDCMEQVRRALKRSPVPEAPAKEGSE